jgi:hypothetical protein
VGYSLSPSGLKNSHSTKNSEEPGALMVRAEIFTCPFSVLGKSYVQYEKLTQPYRIIGSHGRRVHGLWRQ